MICVNNGALSEVCSATALWAAAVQVVCPISTVSVNLFAEVINADIGLFWYDRSLMCSLTSNSMP